MLASCRRYRLRWKTHFIWLTASLPDSASYHYYTNLCCLTLNRFTPHQPRCCYKAPRVFPDLPAGNPLPRHTETTAWRYANVDAIRLWKHLQGHHTQPFFSLPPFSTSFNLSRVPSIITMSPTPPLGKVSFWWINGKRPLQQVKAGAVLCHCHSSGSDKQFAYLLKYYRN